MVFIPGRWVKVLFWPLWPVALVYWLRAKPPSKTPQRHIPVFIGVFGVFDPQHDPLCGGSKTPEIARGYWDVADVADRDPIEADSETAIAAPRRPASHLFG